MLNPFRPIDAPVVSPPPSLDDLRNKVTSDDHIAGRTARVHTRSRRSRARVLCALDSRCSDRPSCESWDDAQRLVRRRNRVYGCCRTPVLYLDDNGMPLAVWGYCRDRLCSTCQAQRARHVALRARAIIEAYNAPRFLTLTIAADGRGLKDRLDHLVRSFRQFRRTRSFREHVLGGLATLEVTYNDRTGNWHAHIHAVIDGEFWDQAGISDTWLSATGDSKVVDIRAVHDRSEIARYLAKYVAKAADVEYWPDAAIREYAIAMSGRRLLLTFGKSHARQLDIAPESEKRHAREILCQPDFIIRYAVEGNQYAIRAILYARLLGPQWALLFNTDVPTDYDPKAEVPRQDYLTFMLYLDAAVNGPPGNAPLFPP